jgi:hypothetical protein
MHARNGMQHRTRCFALQAVLDARRWVYDRAVTGMSGGFGRPKVPVHHSHDSDHDSDQ